MDEHENKKKVAFNNLFGYSNNPGHIRLKDVLHVNNGLINEFKLRLKKDTTR